jgi:hypothetical protein
MPKAGTNDGKGFAAAHRPLARFGYRVEPWSEAMGISRAHTYNLMSGIVRGAPPLPFVRVGDARVITMSPEQYAALCAEQAST